MTNDELKSLRETLGAAEEKTLVEIIRQAESFLQAQLQAGLASDNRAMTTAAMLSAVLAFIVGGAATVYAAAEIHLGRHWIAIAILIGGLLISLAAAMRAARPTEFDYAGSNPRFWAADISGGKSLAQSLAGQATQYADGISKNKAVLKAGQYWLTFCQIVMAITIIAALLFEAYTVYQTHSG